MRKITEKTEPSWLEHNQVLVEQPAAPNTGGCGCRGKVVSSSVLFQGSEVLVVVLTVDARQGGIIICRVPSQGSEILVVALTQGKVVSSSVPSQGSVFLWQC